MIAEIWRGEIRESVHIAHAASCDTQGALKWGSGDPLFFTSLRSAAKPMQAIPLLELGIDLSQEELAICCASHPGLPEHVALAGKVLERTGLEASSLVCGSLDHGCSGNHAGLLLAAGALGEMEGYHEITHPIQLRVLSRLEDLSGCAGLPVGPDGCGIPTFGMSLKAMARVFARLCADSSFAPIPRAMVALPRLIGARDWIDVLVMEASRGRIVAKTGAEGLLCLGLVGQGVGMAIKIGDGSTRALGHVVLEALWHAGWVTDAEIAGIQLTGDVRLLTE